MSIEFKSKYACFAIAAMCASAFETTVVRAAVSDADINYYVKDALRADPRVDGSNIGAETSNGIVTLTGRFDNLAAKSSAVAEAKKINGVLGVIDKITIKPEFRWDSDIGDAVRRRILNSAVIRSQGLIVMCKDGVVTLTGTVDSYPEEHQAGLLASEVRGVKEVKNDIITKWNKSRSDSEIKNDIVTTLGNDVYLIGLPLTVAVQDGVVTLSGTVGNAYEKDRAYDDVRWIENVKKVTNSLRVEWYENQGVKTENETPSDDVLKQTVRKLIDKDSRLVADDISIRTSFGQVTLDGTVGSHYEKEIAEKDAKNVIGVAWVRSNLTVQADQREDWAIQVDVDFNLDTDAVTEGFDLNTNVKKGIVTLTGRVNSWYQWSHAYDVASRVRGVKAVIDNITVSEASNSNGTKWRRDADLVKSIKSGLRADWTTWWVSDKINVSVRNGVATLEGDVNTWNEFQEAGEQTLHTFGISEVDNRLSVKGVAYPWDEHHYKLTNF